jgi:hypothetical protein
MFGADDYIVLAELCSQLAFSCSTPTLSLALMSLASDYLAQSPKQSTCEQTLHPGRGNATALGGLKTLRGFAFAP